MRGVPDVPGTLRRCGTLAEGGIAATAGVR